MKSPWFRRSAALSALALLLPGAGVSSARAAGTLTNVYMASTGSDANDGSITHPKLTLAGALTAVAANGEIAALDSANYGGAAITQGVTITAAPGVFARVGVAGSKDGLAITGSSVGPSYIDVVTLRNLVIEGGDSSASGGSGVTANHLGTLRVENCVIRGFNKGIFLDCPLPSALVVSGGSATRVSTGILLSAHDGSAKTSSAVVSDFEVDDASEAAFAVQTAEQFTTAAMTLRRCVATNNAGAGLSAAGSGAVVYAVNCTVTDNAVGASASSGGKTVSLKNNKLAFNTAGNTFTSTQASQ